MQEENGGLYQRETHAKKAELNIVEKRSKCNDKVQRRLRIVSNTKCDAAVMFFFVRAESLVTMFVPSKSIDYKPINYYVCAMIEQLTKSIVISGQSAEWSSKAIVGFSYIVLDTVYNVKRFKMLIPMSPHQQEIKYIWYGNITQGLHDIWNSAILGYLIFFSLLDRGLQLFI